MGKYEIGPATKIIAILAILGAGWYFAPSSWFNKEKAETKQYDKPIDLPTAPQNAQATVIPFEVPTDAIYVSNTNVRASAHIMGWNSQLGWILANGGAQTKNNSLFAKNGVYMDIIRQDDCAQMQSELVASAAAYKQDPNAPGYFCAVMGDGGAAFMAGVQPLLEKLGPEYKAKIIYSAGRSLGEDKFMASPEVKANKEKARGIVVAAYIKDGDWNIVINWATNNGIPVNHDVTTYDPDAINFYAADTYIIAAQRYNEGYKETRKNKKTGKDIEVTITGVATWTPGDEMIVNGRGGLVNIASTKDYQSQMPNVIIGIDKWMKDHKTYVENMITSIGQGGDQVKSYSQALDLGAKYSAEVYKENDAAYWRTYYTGISKADKQGNVVDLGGSRVHNLGDNIMLFGLKGGENNYAVVYKAFGDIVKDAYPKDVPSYPEVSDVLDMSYLNDVISKAGDKISAPEQTTFTSDQIRNVVAEKNWTIEFASGSSVLTSQGISELEKLYSELIIGSSLKLEIHGHTDNTGTPDANKNLSELRAFAIKQWLQQRNPTRFPDNSITTYAHGQDSPLVPNTSKENMKKNRRVEIKQGS